MAWQPDYITVAQLRDYLKVQDSDDDVQIAFAITAASRAVDKATNRQFGQDGSAVARYYTPVWDHRLCRWIVTVDDIQDITGMTVAYDSSSNLTFATTVTSYRLLPLNAAAGRRPYTEIQMQQLGTGTLGLVLQTLEGTVKVTVKFGWTAVPDAVVQATLIQASRFMMRRDSPYGVAGSAADGNAPMRLQSRVDPDVAVILSPYKRWWAAA